MISCDGGGGLIPCAHHFEHASRPGDPLYEYQHKHVMREGYCPVCHPDAFCPVCHGVMEYVEQISKWYCPKCDKVR